MPCPRGALPFDHRGGFLQVSQQMASTCRVIVSIPCRHICSLWSTVIDLQPFLEARNTGNASISLTPVPLLRVPSSLTPSLTWPCQTSLHYASLFQILSVLPPRGLLPEIDSEKARPSFVSLCLWPSWSVLIVFK